MNNIMLDLETLGTGANAAIISIGAVYFDENGLGETFYRNIDFNTSMLYGGIVDGNTINWWLQQSDDARNSLLTNQKHIKDALIDFKDFCFKGGADVKVWGNGAGFDNVILANAYKRIHMVAPWKFYNDRCYRTIKSLFPNHKIEKSGIYHNALDDAKNQALHLIDLAKKYGIQLTEKETV